MARDNKTREKVSDKAAAMQRRIKERVAAKKCLTCECKPIARGLCWRCRKAAERLVDTEQVTEEYLIHHGLILPTGKQGRRSKCGLILAVEKLEGKEPK